jgi:gamma-glutamylcyclotransferase (GGCT)/AIG2-like uncharacterized protein YtfP
LSGCGTVRFFLYGTLMQGACNPVAQRFHMKLGRLSAATSRGRMVAIPDADGWYPAFFFDEAGPPVHGLLVETLPTFTEADLAALDAYEGAEYRRDEIAVEDGGVVFMAHAWLWAGALSADAEPVADGDFFAWLGRHGLAPYGAA